MKGRTKFILAAVALALWACALWQHYLAHPAGGPCARRPVSFPRAASSEPSFFQREFLDRGGNVPSVHASSLCELPGGQLCAAWYGGTRELDCDVAVYFAKETSPGSGRWTVPRPVVTASAAMAELNRFVNKVGNSVIFADAQGRLWLVYVSIAMGRWSGSSLNVKISADGGERWTASRRLTLNPFLNLSELVRTKPFSVTEEGVGLPVYHEFIARFPEVVWLSGDGAAGSLTWSKQRICRGDSYLQPSIVWSSEKELSAFLRDCSGKNVTGVSRSADGGQSWEKPHRIALPNPGAGMDALRLSDGRLLMAFNDSSSTRENMRLAISRDGGETWQRVATLDEEAGSEFSYPYLIQDHFGRIHVAYTWKRKHIQHVIFNLGWLDQQKGKESPR